jgi:hypothetical protein
VRVRQLAGLGAGRSYSVATPSPMTTATTRKITAYGFGDPPAGLMVGVSTAHLHGSGCDLHMAMDA